MADRGMNAKQNEGEECGHRCQGDGTAEDPRIAC